MPRVVANEARKLKRAGKPSTGKELKKQLSRPMAAQRGEAPDPLGAAAIKKMLGRLSIPVVAVWVIGILVAGFARSTTTITVALVIPSVVTLGVAGVVVWALRQAKKAKSVAGILAQAEDAEGRAAALNQLETQYKKKDPTALFAKAQLQMQEDPKAALATLEQINLSSVMAAVADEARAQRAMIHLMLGQPQRARELADGINLSRHQEAKSRAMIGAVVAEAWARTGQAQKALDTLDLFDPTDEELSQIGPQLSRARAYAYAHTQKVKPMRRELRRLLDQDIRLLASFVEKKAHPLLQREAKRLIEQSGQAPRRVQAQRRV